MKKLNKEKVSGGYRNKKLDVKMLKQIKKISLKLLKKILTEGEISKEWNKGVINHIRKKKEAMLKGEY